PAEIVAIETSASRRVIFFRFILPFPKRVQIAPIIHDLRTSSREGFHPNFLDQNRSDRFDIRAQGDAALTPARFGPAVLAMLQNRFQLRTRTEMRDLQVYALVIAKGGSKL